MAKIGALQVDTIHIPPAAITATTIGNPVSVSNPAVLPIEIHGTCTIQYRGVSCASNGQATYRIRRSRENAILFEETYSFTGSSGQSALINASILDHEAQGSETYSVQTVPVFNPGMSGGNGFLTMTPSSLFCVAVKR